MLLLIFVILINRDNVDDPLDDKATLLQQLDQVFLFIESISATLLRPQI